MLIMEIFHHFGTTTHTIGRTERAAFFLSFFRLLFFHKYHVLLTWFGNVRRWQRRVGRQGAKISPTAKTAALSAKISIALAFQGTFRAKRPVNKISRKPWLSFDLQVLRPER